MLHRLLLSNVNPPIQRYGAQKSSAAPHDDASSTRRMRLGTKELIEKRGSRKTRRCDPQSPPLAKKPRANAGPPDGGARTDDFAGDQRGSEIRGKNVGRKSENGVFNQRGEKRLHLQRIGLGDARTLRRRLELNRCTDRFCNALGREVHHGPRDGYRTVHGAHATTARVATSQSASRFDAVGIGAPKNVRSNSERSRSVSSTHPRRCRKRPRGASSRATRSCELRAIWRNPR